MVVEKGKTSMSQKDGWLAGVFRVRDVQSRFARNNRPYVCMLVEDSFGQMPAFSWDVQRHRLTDLRLYWIEGRSRYWAGRRVLDLTRVEPIRSSMDPPGTRLLPYGLCKKPEWLPRLVAIVESLTCSVLRNFVDAVFLDEKISLGFISLPASVHHHHSYPGGLLVHSIECAEMVLRAYPDEGMEKELGIVAALLHDIGKVRTMMPGRKKTTLGYVMDHNHLTLEVLAPYMSNLERDWVDGAIALRYLLAWNRNQSPLPLMPIAEVVRAADRISSALDARRLAYKDQPDWRRFGKLAVPGYKNRFWKPALDTI